MGNPEVLHENPRQNKSRKSDVERLKFKIESAVDRIQLEEFLEEICDMIRNNKHWKIMYEYWKKKISDEDRTRLYRYGKMTLLDTVTGKGNPVSPLFALRQAKNVMTYNSITLGLVAQTMAPAYRHLVQLDLLPGPNELTDKRLRKDIKADYKQLQLALSLLVRIIGVFAPELLPEFEIMKLIVTKLNKTKANLALEIQRGKGGKKKAA